MTVTNRLAATVVVPVHNEVAGIRATLEALARQTLDRSEFEVVVVDDASTDGTAEAAAEDPGVRVVRLARGGGSYVARNRGVGAATGVVLAFTDAGCLPDPEWLASGVRALQSDPGQVIGGRIRMPLGDRPTIAAMVDVVHHLDQRRYIENDGYAVTANLLTTRATFDAVGPFDEQLRSSGDRDWTTRSGTAGARLVYRAEVTVVHPPRTTASELLSKSRRVGMGAKSLRGKHGGDRGRPPYLRMSTYRPRHRARGRLRLQENGFSPGFLRWLLVGVGQVVWVQAPQAFAGVQRPRLRLRGPRS